MGVEWRSFKSGQPVPEGAFVGGQEPDGSPLYVARVHLNEDGVESIHPGKFGEQTGRGALVGYAGTEKYSGSYDLLIATPDEVKWVDQDGPLASAEGLNPVDGGHDGQGHKLYVAHVAIDKAIVPGKAFDGCQGGQAAFAGKESQPIQWWAILCHA